MSDRLPPEDRRPSLRVNVMAFVYVASTALWLLGIAHLIHHVFA